MLVVRCIVLDILQGLNSFIDHQPNAVHQVVAVPDGVPGGVDHVDLRLDRGVSVCWLGDDDIRPQLSQSPDEVDQVSSSLWMFSSSVLYVQINSITSIFVRPLGNSLRHLLCYFFGQQPLPGIRIQRINKSSNDKHDQCVLWH